VRTAGPSTTLRFGRDDNSLVTIYQVLASTSASILNLRKKLSSRPERTRISYITAPHAATYVAFRKESRMKFAKATKFDRKSGGA
jgi:hypothetical protein